MAKNDERIDKRRVTMTNSIVTEEDGQTVTRLITATDYVRPDVLDAYVTDARRRWEHVTVSDEPDAGPAGYDGPTFVPFGSRAFRLDNSGRVVGEEWHEFPHPLAGSYFPATDCKNCKHAPEHPLTGDKARTVRGS